MFVRGLGIGFIGMPLTTSTLVSVDPSHSQDASTQVNVLQRVGASLVLVTAIPCFVLMRHERVRRSLAPA